MGWTYNTVDPNAETNAPTIVAVGVSFCTISLVFVCLRIYVRKFMINAFAVDDWAIVVTWFMSAGFLIVTALQTKWGLGLQDLEDMPAENYFNFGLLQFSGAPFYISSIFGFKLSLLLSFLRIAVEKSHRYAIIGIICACAAFNFSFLMAQVNLCNPIKKQWDPSVIGGNCITAVPMYTTMAAITIVFDVIIMLTPFPMLLKTQLQTKKKVIILGLFSLGTFITVIQLIRILTIKSLSNAIDSSQLIMWSMVENNLGIIVASIPPLSPLVRSFKERSSGNRSKKGSGLPYALQSMPTGNRDRNGHTILGSGHDNLDHKDESRTVVVGGGQMDNSSEEYIFPQSASGIYQKTEITVTQEPNSRTPSAQEHEEWGHRHV